MNATSISEMAANDSLGITPVTLGNTVNVTPSGSTPIMTPSIEPQIQHHPAAPQTPQHHLQGGAQGQMTTIQDASSMMLPNHVEMPQPLVLPTSSSSEVKPPVSDYQSAAATTTSSMGPNLTPCPICPHIFVTVNEMRSHLETEHRKYQCELCKKLMSHKRNVDRHRKSVHENQRGFGCPMCNYKSAHKQVVLNCLSEISARVWIQLLLWSVSKAIFFMFFSGCSTPFTNQAPSQARGVPSYSLPSSA